MNLELAKRLIEAAEEDKKVREVLAADGSLFGGYHPKMKEVHDRNMELLIEIITAYQWPTRSLVGEEASHAAWVIVQHAIGNPDFQRRCLMILKPLAEAGEVAPQEVAMLEDRILSFSGEPQRYGTQFDWDERGEMSPLPVDDVDLVDKRRKALGWPPLAQEIKNRRVYVRTTREQPPLDFKQYQQAKKKWLKETGWR